MFLVTCSLAAGDEREVLGCCTCERKHLRSLPAFRTNLDRSSAVEIKFGYSIQKRRSIARSRKVSAMSTFVRRHRHATGRAPLLIPFAVYPHMKKTQS